MANTQAICSSFKVDILNGVHHFGTGSPDAFKAALYLASATKDGTTAAYNTTGEVTGTNYTAGGVTVTNATAPANIPAVPTTPAGDPAVWTPSANFVYTNVTLTTAFDAVLLYNNTAAGKNAVSVHTFGSQTITAGTLTLTMPANTVGNALLQVS